MLLPRRLQDRILRPGSTKRDAGDGAAKDGRPYRGDALVPAELIALRRSHDLCKFSMDSVMRLRYCRSIRALGVVAEVV